MKCLDSKEHEQQWSGDLNMRSMVDKRKSELYRQICGFVPKDLYKKFKSTLALREVAQNEAVEIAIRKWLEEGEEGNK